MGLVLAALVAAGAAVLAPAPVAAQEGRLADGGMDLHLFRPAVDSKGFITVNGTDILGANDFSFGLILDAGFGILPYEGLRNQTGIRISDAGDRDRIVDQFFTGTFHFNYGIANLLVLGFQVPVQVVNGPNVTVPGPDGVEDGFYNNPAMGQGEGLDYQGLGNVTLHGKLRLTRVERAPVGLAALVQVELPTGDADRFAGEPGVGIWPSIAAEIRPNLNWRFGANLGYRINTGEGARFPVGGRSIAAVDDQLEITPQGLRLDPDDQGGDFQYDDLLTWGLAGSVRPFDVIEFVVETYGSWVLTSGAEEGAFSWEAIGGLKVFVQRNSYLFLGAGAGIPVGGFQSADVRGFLGFIFEPSIADRDGDGLKDDIDQCPDEPEDYDTFADDDGCPDPDNDRDGILDIDDECSLVPEDRDGDADLDGCPEGNMGDRDGDGILDDADECPDDPEDRDEFADDDGCPDPDNDQDTILDVDDLCPNDPEDADGWDDTDGCPDPDNDQDRILDVDDACPNDPEKYNGFEDEDGCPDRGIVILEENQIKILQKVYFEVDSAQIQLRSFPLLDAVAATMVGNPQIKLVEVQGHADERATDEYNIRLTRDRAAAVVEALVERGVERDRLRSAGYGERCPLDPRHNPRAWEKNRRVEFKIIETDTGPTDIEIACPAGQELIPQ
jgi:outer membrane protein OmpA-like peptidoglycan-associated protein